MTFRDQESLLDLHAHLGSPDDDLAQPRARDDAILDWRRFLDDDPPSWQLDVLREHARTGRPLGTPAFFADLEWQVVRQFAVPAKRGRKLGETIGPAID